MKKIKFVLSDNTHLIWFDFSRTTYNDFCSKLLSGYLKDYGLSIKKIVKTSDHGSTTTFDLTFDN